VPATDSAVPEPNCLILLATGVILVASRAARPASSIARVHSCFAPRCY
jgi:hypothetical protein